ncbi:uncharacterized protein [Fopius arisanus]|uniref:Uncharacterized protein n=1 Tax=Fopius arisanus TaxID=64838 RepID=A0A9R1TZ56_9HYME|nr:PREDICTED: uncharacterized protein LOC105265478 [Fopius arisanus]
MNANIITQYSVESFTMKIIMLIAIIAVPTIHVHGEDVVNLIKIVEDAMNKVGDYGNNFVGPLREKLSSDYLRTKTSLDIKINQMYNESLIAVKSAADKNGVNASICVEGLKQELDGIITDKFPDFEFCMKHTMNFAMEFTAFIQNQGNTGYVMIEGLQQLRKSYSKLPVSHAEKCYEGLTWYTSAVSHNYAGSSGRLVDVGQSLYNYSVQNVFNCFQKPIALIREELLTVEGRVKKCIADKINNKPLENL